MDAGLKASLSGINAAAARINVASSNIANAGSTAAIDENGDIVNKPYKPLEVVQSTPQEGAGTLATVKSIASPSVPVYDPSKSVADQNGIVQFPNVDEGEQALNLILARNSYKASVTTLQATDKAYSSLIDTVG